ncbi:MAG: DUF2892 domain-containing protein [Rhodospirillales bacterium]|nr:DUF2892 domain-containing protein [Rhodospirillales bacterium]
MQRNVGNIDRGIRGLVGVVLLLVFFVAPPANAILYWACLVVGVVMVGTAALGWCPAYLPIGLSTCKKD